MREINNKLKIALTWYIIIFIVNTIIIYFFKQYEISSIFYPILLSFPLFLILIRIEKLENIGFRKGEIKKGLIWIVISLIFFLLAVATTIFYYNGSIIFVFSYQLFLYILIGPILEETFFRGYLQTKFVERTGMWIGLLYVSILFAIMHIPKTFLSNSFASGTIPFGEIFSLISIFIFGFFIGYVYNHSKSVYYVILIHVLVNLFPYIISF